MTFRQLWTNTAIKVTERFSSFHLSWCCDWIFFSGWNLSFHSVKGMGVFCRDKLMTPHHRDSLRWKILLRFYGSWWSHKGCLFSKRLQLVCGFRWHCLHIRFLVAYFLKRLRNVHRAAISEEDILHCRYHCRAANSAAAVIKKQRRVEENFKWGLGIRSPKDRGEQRPNYSKLDRRALHSSHCLWELLTLLANTSLAWVS